MNYQDLIDDVVRMLETAQEQEWDFDTVAAELSDFSFNVVLGEYDA